MTFVIVIVIQSPKVIEIDRTKGKTPPGNQPPSLFVCLSLQFECRKKGHQDDTENISKIRVKLEHLRCSQISEETIQKNKISWG